MGTLIKRICDPSHMTDAEKAAIMSDRGYTHEDQLKLRLHAVVGVAQEIMSGRMSSGAMGTWLTTAEQGEASIMISKMVNGDITVTEVWLICLLGELGIYTPSQVESIFGL